MRWLAVDELDDVDWLDSDRPFLPALRELLVGDRAELRAVLFDEEHALAVAAAPWPTGSRPRRAASPSPARTTTRTIPWAVTTDAPALLVEPLVDEHDGWLDDESAARSRATRRSSCRALRVASTARRLQARPMTVPPRQRLLLVHAHPDDESIGHGATMAKYVAEGRGVTLVTCTAGEMGEILVPDIEHLAADRDDGLGEHRRGELEAAMKELGVTDHRFLGGFGRYRDSGMKWHEDGHAIAADDTDERRVRQRRPRPRRPTSSSR